MRATPSGLLCTADTTKHTAAATHEGPCAGGRAPTLHHTWLAGAALNASLKTAHIALFPLLKRWHIREKSLCTQPGRLNVSVHLQIVCRRKANSTSAILPHGQTVKRQLNALSISFALGTRALKQATPIRSNAPSRRHPTCNAGHPCISLAAHPLGIGQQPGIIASGFLPGHLANMRMPC